MLQKSNFVKFFFKKPPLKNDYLYENESFASTNKDSYMTSSIKGNNYYTSFRINNSIKRNNNNKETDLKAYSINNRIHSYMNQIINKEKKYEYENEKGSNIIFNYNQNTSSNINYFNKRNQDKFSLINKTKNILNIKNANIKKDLLKYDFKNYFTHKHNNINKRKLHDKKILNEKKNKTQSIRINKKQNFSRDIEDKNFINKTSNNNFDLNEEKNKIDLIKKQYIKKINNTKIIFHDIKLKMCNIQRYQNKILEINKKSLKYSDLISSDNLMKYKEENKKNLKEYKSKKNQKNKRPLSCITKNNKIKNNNKKFIKKRIFSAEIGNKNKKEIRNLSLKEKLRKIDKYDNIRNHFYNSLKYYNDLLDKNKDKKQKILNRLKGRSSDNIII